jgi:hypothetical protein
MNIVSDIDSDNSASDPCVRPPLKLLQDCDRLESSTKGVKNKRLNISTLMTGIVTWICRAPEARAIRVSYHEGAILSDWIPVDEMPALKAEWPPKPCRGFTKHFKDESFVVVALGEPAFGRFAH